MYLYPRSLLSALYWTSRVQSFDVHSSRLCLRQSLLWQVAPHNKYDSDEHFPQMRSFWVALSCVPQTEQAMVLTDEGSKAQVFRSCSFKSDRYENLPYSEVPLLTLLLQYPKSINITSTTSTSKRTIQSVQWETEMLVSAAARPLVATIGRRTFARSFAKVGSQIPNVELHSWVLDFCISFVFLFFFTPTHQLLTSIAHWCSILYHPSTITENFPPEKIALGPYLKDKNVVIVGLPGAFTPTWSTKQIPDYVSKQDALRDKGVTEVIILAVNDGAVMMNWAKSQWVEILVLYCYVLLFFMLGHYWIILLMCICLHLCSLWHSLTLFTGGQH